MAKTNYELIKDEMSEIRKDVQELREKVFNGLLDRTKLNTRLILMILMGVILSIIVPIVRSFF